MTDHIATIRRYIDVLPDIAYQKSVRKALDEIEAELQHLRHTTLSSALQAISGNRLRPEVGDPDQSGDPTDAVYNQAVRDCQVAVRALIDTPESEAPDPTESTLGHVIWHSSDEDSGPDVGISIGLGSGKTLWIGEIFDDAYDEGGEEAKALGDSGGWWLMMYPDRIPFAKFTNGYEARNFAERLEALICAKAQRASDPRDAEIERGAADMPLSDVNDLDDVVVALGIEDSDTTPAEAVAELHAEIERLRALVYACGLQFRDYERQRLAKSPPDIAKAKTNAGFAERCEGMRQTPDRDPPGAPPQ